MFYGRPFGRLDGNVRQEEGFFYVQPVIGIVLVLVLFHVLCPVLIIIVSVLSSQEASPSMAVPREFYTKETEDRRI